MKQILAVLALCALAAPAAAEELAMTPKMQKAVTGVIKLEGFNCPIAKLALKKGPSARGDVVKVHCGPDDGSSNVYSDFSYRVTFRPDGGIDVKEW